MKATLNSKNNIITNKTNRIFTPSLSGLAIGILIKAKIKCPATIFAASRTLRVKGRIRFLTISIKTINGAKNTGDPTGTKWANILLVLFFKLITIYPNQKGIPKDILIARWLVGVNT